MTDVNGIIYQKCIEGNIVGNHYVGEQKRYKLRWQDLPVESVIKKLMYV